VKAGVKAQNKSGEPLLAPFLGLPKDLLDPILKDVVDGNLTLQAAHKSAYAIKAEIRMAGYIDKILQEWAVEEGEEEDEAHTYEEVVSDPVKTSLLAQFKSKASDKFSSCFVIFRYLVKVF
jgi:hypothetical protein